MKVFLNKETKILNEKGEPLTFASLAILSLDKQPQEGWTTSEMKIRFKIEDVLKEHLKEDEIQMDDEWIKVLLSLSTYGWALRHKDILAYSDHLEELIKQK